jgi:hypothetical protein
MNDKTALLPAAAGASTVGATFLGLSVPDWVGIATIVYMAVMAAIALHKHYTRPFDDE